MVLECKYYCDGEQFLRVRKVRITGELNCAFRLFMTFAVKKKYFFLHVQKRLIKRLNIFFCSTKSELEEFFSFIFPFRSSSNNYTKTQCP